VSWLLVAGCLSLAAGYLLLVADRAWNEFGVVYLASVY